MTAVQAKAVEQAAVVGLAALQQGPRAGRVAVVVSEAEERALAAQVEAAKEAAPSEEEEQAVGEVVAAVMGAKAMAEVEMA